MWITLNCVRCNSKISIQSTSDGILLTPEIADNDRLSVICPQCNTKLHLILRVYSSVWHRGK